MSPDVFAAVSFMKRFYPVTLKQTELPEIFFKSRNTKRQIVGFTPYLERGGGEDAYFWLDSNLKALDKLFIMSTS